MHFIIGLPFLLILYLYRNNLQVSYRNSLRNRIYQLEFIAYFGPRFIYNFDNIGQNWAILESGKFDEEHRHRDTKMSIQNLPKERKVFQIALMRHCVYLKRKILALKAASVPPK